MYSTTRGKMLGLLYLAPLVIFVAMFTAYPLIQMVWMSFHNWSIIAPAKWVGVANFVKAWNDRQFWVSLGFTLKYTVYDEVTLSSKPLCGASPRIISTRKMSKDFR
jgi:multiple sugar transport system permease protein